MMSKFIGQIMSGDLYLEDLDLLCIDEGYLVSSENQMNVLLLNYYYN